MFKCIICGSNKFIKIKEHLRDSDTHKVLQCEGCNQVQISPMPSVDADKEYYSKDMQTKSVFDTVDMKVMEEKAMIDVQRRYQMFKDYIDKRDNILEIGCGYGFFVNYLGKMGGYNIEGIEISDSRRNYGVHELGCKIYDINLLSTNIPDDFKEKYDVIFMFHVLEHINQPELFLKQTRTLLKSGGTLIIEVPNLDDHMLERSTAYRNFYFQRAHLTYFNQETFNKLIEKSNLKTINIQGVQRYDLGNALHWMNRASPQLGSERPITIDWVENYYKKTIENNLTCDTIVAYCKKQDII